MPGTILTSIHEFINLILTTTPDEKTESQRYQQLTQGPSAGKGYRQGSSPESVSRAHTLNLTLHSHWSLLLTNTPACFFFYIDLKAVPLEDIELGATVRIIQLKSWVLFQFFISF